MIDNYIVIDDIISSEKANEIESILIQQMDWHFISDVTFAIGADYRHTPAFAHMFKNTEWGPGEDPYLQVVKPILDSACEKINFKYTSIQKARSFLQVPLNKKFTSTTIDALHVDQPYSHLVVLYYVCDSDGDTILVDHRRTAHTEYNLEAKDYNELVRVTPKKGRCVIFNGDIYHTAEQPKNNLRCIVNFNLL